MHKNRSLICITSCNRLAEVRKYLLPYFNFCIENDGFDFLLSLDGKGEDYLEFCEEWNVPLIYSEEREGVGLSKNRVLKSFPDYKYYFFIDDDVELYDSSIFHDHIRLQEETGYGHFVVTDLKKVTDEEVKYSKKLVYGDYGGGYFNFYEGDALRKVGGWHTLFAKYRRYGHTEHTYRFYKQGLTPYPFIVIKDSVNKLILHNPPHVTDPLQADAYSELIEEEELLIESDLKYFPVKIISKAYHMNIDLAINKQNYIAMKTGTKLYPLLSRSDRRKALSSRLFFLAFLNENWIVKILYILRAFIRYPGNPEIRHWIKTSILKLK